MEPMNEALADQYRDKKTMARLRDIATGIFARRGVDITTARRGNGWSNAIWLAGGLVLRMSISQGNENLRREAQLAPLLPEEVGYPPVLENGVIEGYAWSLSLEIPGEPLGAVWSRLDWDERISALRQMWQKAQAVHNVDLDAASALARKRAWFNSNDAAEAGASAARLLQQKLITARQAELLNKALSRFWEILPAAACVLNHGDLSLDNVLWRQGQVVSLLDFEFAVVAPPELDWNTLLKHAFAPASMDESSSDSDNPGRQRLRQVMADLATPLLARPESKTLLFGYALLLEMWMLEDWLAHPEGEGPLEGWEPYRRLRSLLDGQAGYLAPVFAQAGFANG